MLKVLLGVAIVAFTTLCGYLLSRKYRQRKQFFRQLSEFNERFLNEISYYRRPIRDFITTYAYQGEFHDLLQSYLMNLEQSSPNPMQLLEESAYAFLKEDEKTLITNYFFMLGKGDSSSQKGYFNSVKSVLGKWQSDAVETGKKYEDLYIKLGFLCGLFILILII